MVLLSNLSALIIADKEYKIMIRPITMHSPLNFKAKTNTNPKAESRNFVDKQDGHNVFQILKNDVLVYERLELENLDKGKKHVISREYWDNGNIKSIHEETLKDNVQTTYDAKYDKDGNEYSSATNVDASNLYLSYPW